MTTKQIYQTWLARDQTSRVVETLSKEFPKNEDITLVSARYHAYTRAQLRGTLSHEQANVEIAQIRKSILDLLEQLEWEIAPPTVTTPPSNQQIVYNIQKAGIVVTGDGATFNGLNQHF
jgi:actin-like ATPase involved in cell morphogenesis